ncbi:MAG: glycoside hydrolase family 65 protein [Spirochaetales bacterium]|nr:glycoside hydrolase family 65 protein [Spirochaetales bacterium]
MSFKVAESTALTGEVAEKFGGKFLTGNGFLGVRGTLEEYTREDKPAVNIAGLYDQVGDSWREPVNAPNGCYIKLYYGDVPCHYASAGVKKHSQTLYLDNAVHERDTEFAMHDGNAVRVTSRKFVSLTDYHLICIEYRFSVSKGGAISIHTGIDGDVWDINGPHLAEVKCSEKRGLLEMSAVTNENRVALSVAVLSVFPCGESRCIKEKNRITRQINFKAEAGKEYTLYKFAAVHTGMEDAEPSKKSLATCRSAMTKGFDAVLEDHSIKWKKRWEQCDVTIEGDETAQLALRYSLYHLLAVMPEHSGRVSIPARGLSGQVYKGGIFWDTEIFMLPFFIYSFPSVARNLLMYRFHTLDGARRKAAEYGYKGAFYAWESQDTGDDACTLFNVTDVFTNRPMRTYFRDKQIHISGDVVYAAWKYYEVTGDDSVFYDGMAEVVFECARFFASFVYYSPYRRRYEFLDVTGPDEYHERVNNNAFTNMMAAHTLDVCLWIYELLQGKNPGFLKSLMGRLNFVEDLGLIREIRDKLYQPNPDEKTGVIPQFDGYFRLKEITVEELLEQKLHEYEYLGGGNGLATATRVIKQADVVLVMVLFGEKFPFSIKRKNWEYYEPRTEHGSSLSACAYSLIASETGFRDYAYEYFLKTAMIDLTGKSKQYVGDLYIGGTHPAANGGAWMSFAMGFCGISYSGKELSVNPRLPAAWEFVSFPMMVNGVKLRLRITRDNVEINTIEGEPEGLTVNVCNTIHALSGGKKISIALSKRRAL